MENRTHLLIVDDEVDLRETLSDALSDLDGVKISTAGNGQEALDSLLASQHSDCPITVILSDIQMPKMTGLELIRAIRSHKLDTPVVFLTGYGDREKAIEALRYGAFDLLDKPCENTKILETMRGAIDYAQRLDRLWKDFETQCRERGLNEFEVASLRQAQAALIHLKAVGTERMPLSKRGPH